MSYLVKMCYLSVIMLPFACAAASAQPVTMTTSQPLALQDWCFYKGIPKTGCAPKSQYVAKADCPANKRIVSVSCSVTNFNNIKGLYDNIDGMCVWGMTAEPDTTTRAIITLGCQR